MLKLITVARAVLASSAFAAPAFAQVTGTVDIEVKVQAFDAGAIDYITKPFNAEVVQARVRNQLALAKARDDLRQANEALRKYKAAVDGSSTGIAITDRDGGIEYVNEAFAEATGWSREEVVERNIEVLRDPEFREDAWKDLRYGLEKGIAWRGELRNRRRDGGVLWQDVSVSPVRDDSGQVTHAVAIFSDIGPRKQMEDELRWLAVTDVLTGLANRRRLMEAGTQELVRSQRSGDPVSLIMIDIDHFKTVNDTWGHPAGDEVIRMVATTISQAVRAIDLAGRVGGEELAILLPMTQGSGAVELAERIRAAVQAKAVKWQDQEIKVTISVGVAQGHGRTKDFVELVKAADQALYRAKQGGRNRVAATLYPPQEDEVEATS